MSMISKRSPALLKPPRGMLSEMLIHVSNIRPEEEAK
jgi:hypothetical protein